MTIAKHNGGMLKRLGLTYWKGRHSDKRTVNHNDVQSLAKRGLVDLSLDDAGYHTARLTAKSARVSP